MVSRTRSTIGYTPYKDPSQPIRARYETTAAVGQKGQVRGCIHTLLIWWWDTTGKVTGGMHTAHLVTRNHYGFDVSTPRIAIIQATIQATRSDKGM